MKCILWLYCPWLPSYQHHEKLGKIMRNWSSDTWKWMVRTRNELAHRKELAPRICKHHKGGVSLPTCHFWVNCLFPEAFAPSFLNSVQLSTQSREEMFWSLLWRLKQNPMDLGLEHQTFASISHRLGAGSQGAHKSGCPHGRVLGRPLSRFSRLLAASSQGRGGREQALWCLVF